jgi:hypothetical protein
MMAGQRRHLTSAWRDRPCATLCYNPPSVGL